MLKNIPISLSWPVMNIKLALKLCHFDILINIGWLQQLKSEAWADNIFTQQTIDEL